MLLDSSRIIFIKSIMGSTTPKYLTKSASTLSPNSHSEDAFLSCCSSIIDNDNDKFNETVKIASYYKVVKDVRQFTEKFKEFKEAKYIEKYAYSQNNVKSLPVDTKHNFQKSDSIFGNNYMRYPFEDRGKIAATLLKKAQEYAVDTISPATIFYSTEITEDLDYEKIARAIENRATLMQHPLQKKQYETLAKVASTKKFKLIKLATILEKLDRQNHLYPYNDQQGMYGNTVRLCDPVTQFMGCVKQSQEESFSDKSITLGDDEYKISDLKQLPLDVYKKAVGADLAYEIVKGSSTEMYRTLEGLDHMTKIILGKYIKNERPT